MVKYDQHFLENEEILIKIANSCISTKDDVLVEIGPGKGALTKHLVDKKFEKLFLIEKDISFNSYLEQYKSNSIFLVNGDGVSLLDQYNPTILIGNIPYSITESLYRKILELSIPQAVLLHGKDFYTTIISRSQSKWYYYINSFYDIKLIAEVKGDEFNPSTKVNSVAINLQKKVELSKPDLFWQEFFKKESRNTKNTLMYALIDSMDYTKKQVQEILIRYPRNYYSIKTSQLSNTDFNDLVSILQKENILR